MWDHDARQVFARLPKSAMPFDYFKDRYALMLLRDALPGDVPIRALRASRYARLLSRPVVRTLIGHRGNGRIGPADLDPPLPAGHQRYDLTLGRWGEGCRRHWSRTGLQMVRRGWNLVLQLHFSAPHVRDYRRLVQPNAEHPFELPAHPVARGGYQTLAWARIDLDLNYGEALIEEIQTDWVREARDTIEMPGYNDSRIKGRRRDVEIYVEHVLRPHAVMWDEAMLSAAIDILRHRLMIEKIYYYDFETGNRCKGLNEKGVLPPRSLYTELPRRFGFERGGTVPRFLASEFDRRLNDVFEQRPAVFWRLPPSPDDVLASIWTDPKKSARRLAG